METTTQETLHKPETAAEEYCGCGCPCCGPSRDEPVPGVQSHTPDEQGNCAQVQTHPPQVVA